MILPSHSREPLNNREVADSLDATAELLETQNANPFRVRSYRRAADTLRGLKTQIGSLLDEEGIAGLVQLPGIGQSLARSIEQLTWTGRLALLERLRGDLLAERVFTTVPGIGMDLAARIHETLAIETLADLEAAAYDGRLSTVPGMGPRRVRAVRESLAGRFRRGPAVRVPKAAAPTDEPPISELLSVDDEYRRDAAAGRLVKVAPRRFNPSRVAWLPVLHTNRGTRHYTALYSNTARAHELGTTSDWVVIYRDDRHGDGQWTVVTSRFGKLKGRRIVRGREAACLDHYGRSSSGRLFQADATA